MGRTSHGRFRSTKALRSLFWGPGNRFHVVRRANHGASSTFDVVGKTTEVRGSVAEEQNRVVHPLEADFEAVGRTIEVVGRTNDVVGGVSHALGRADDVVGASASPPTLRMTTVAVTTARRRSRRASRKAGICAIYRCRKSASSSLTTPSKAKPSGLARRKLSTWLSPRRPCPDHRCTRNRARLRQDELQLAFGRLSVPPPPSEQVAAALKSFLCEGICASRPHSSRTGFVQATPLRSCHAAPLDASRGMR
jgi:hypothetical protein